MKKIISILLLVCIVKVTAQIAGGGIVKKLPDASVKIIDGTFTKSAQVGNKPCNNEIYLEIEVEHNLPNSLAIPIRANYYLDNKLIDSLILIGNSYQKIGLVSANNSPYYPETVSTLDSKLKSKTKRNALIRPSSIGIDKNSFAVIDKTLVYNNKRIQVKVPFEYSSEVGPLKLNKYEFYIDKQLYDSVQKTFSTDIQISNNSNSKIYYQRCNSKDVFVKPYPETFTQKEVELSKESEEPEKPINKIINFLHPTDPSLKPGKKLLVQLHNKYYDGYNELLIDIDKAKVVVIRAMGTGPIVNITPRIVKGNETQSFVFDLPLNFPVGAYVCQVYYDKVRDAELFIVHK